jgi:ATP-binding cassette subfamily B protein RaxB
LADLASENGLSADLVSYSSEQFSAARLPGVIAWHKRFATLTEFSRGRARLYDPSLGWRWVSLQEAHTQSRGTVLEVRSVVRPETRGSSGSLRISSLFQWTRIVRGSALQALALTLLIQIYAVVSPLYMQVVIDSVLMRGRAELLTAIAAGFTLVICFNTAAAAARGFVLQRLAAALGWDMSRRVFRHLLRLPLPWFEERRLGDILSRAQAVDQIRSFLTGVLSGSVVDGGLCVLMLVMMLLLEPRLALLAASFTVASIGLRFVSAPIVMRYAAQTMDANAIEQGKRIENLRSITTIKTMEAEEAREIDWSNTLADSILATRQGATIGIYVAAIQTLLTGIGNIVVVYAAARNILDGRLTIGTLYAFLAYQTQFAARAGNVLDLMISWRTVDLYKHRVSDIVLARAEGTSSATPPSEMHPKALALQKVAFTYPGGDRAILQDVDMTINPGDFIAITGPSGAGKSTLLKLMCGLYYPTAGKILLDGEVLSTDDVHVIRRHIGVVLQEDDLLSGSVLDNVCFFASHPDRDHALECLQLAGVDQEVADLPDGVDTILGDLGNSLSGGQRQRIMLARALYRRPSILLLDEATSHLDLERERMINTTLSALDITRIVVAHRTETIAAASRVFELKAGSLREISRVTAFPTDDLAGAHRA